MRAVTIERHGGPEVLQQRDIPVPEPGPGEVLVKVEAAEVLKDVFSNLCETTHELRKTMLLGRSARFV